MTNAVAIAQGGSSNLTMRNRIINPGMVIDQRNAGASVTPTSDAYTVDRWRFQTTQSSKLSFQQNAGSVTPPAGYTNYLGCTSLSAYSVASTDIFVIGQSIEGYNVADLGWGTANASSITVSFWVRSSLTGTFGGSVFNGAGNRSYPFTYTINSANTWEQKTINIAGDQSGTWLTTNGKGMQIVWGLGNGSTVSGTAGSWSSNGYWSATGAQSVVGTSGATFYITGVQLEAGTTASPFEYRQYGTELALCQRYYQTCGTWGGNCNNSTLWLGVFTWGVKMRANPTLGVTGPIVISDFRAADPVQSSAAMGSVLGYSENSACAFLPNYTGLRNDVYYGGNRNTNSNYVTLSAEL